MSIVHSLVLGDCDYATIVIRGKSGIQKSFIFSLNQDSLTFDENRLLRILEHGASSINWITFEGKIAEELSVQILINGNLISLESGQYLKCDIGKLHVMSVELAKQLQGDYGQKLTIESYKPFP
jgi:hypothetical protein